MEIENCLFRTRCDNGACRNTAAFRVVREDTPRLMQLNLCEECARELSASLRKKLNALQKAKTNQNTNKEVQENVGNNT